MNKPIRSHRDLDVWAKSICLVDAIYDMAKTLPRREQFGLWSQLTRCAVSVPTNIAEGHARSTAKDFAHFLTIARSSLMELDTLVEVCLRRQYIDPSTSVRLMGQADEVSRMITGLKRRISAQPNGSQVTPRRLTPHTSHLTPQQPEARR